MDIVTLFKKYVIDNTDTSIKFFYTKTNGYYVIHIVNPNNELLNMNKHNKPFFKILINMLFDTKFKTQTGCFNYEHPDKNDPLYKYSFNELLNYFLKNNYMMILVDINKTKKNPIIPISQLIINNNTLWTLCTNIEYRKKGFMTILLNHLFKLIKNNKLKTFIYLPELKIYIKKTNPLTQMLLKYYSSYGFKKNENENENDYIIMNYNE
jgi:hypothetical protein